MYLLQKKNASRMIFSIRALIYHQISVRTGQNTPLSQKRQFFTYCCLDIKNHLSYIITVRYDILLCPATAQESL